MGLWSSGWFGGCVVWVYVDVYGGWMVGGGV